MSTQATTKPHVLVVGAGVVGASVAWHLARHGAAVTIVASDVGGIATPNSFAWLNASWRNPRFYYDFRRRSMAVWRRLTDDVPGLRAIVNWDGALQWDMPPEELTRFAKEHSAWGYDVRRAERDEIRTREPSLAEDMLPAEWGLRIGEEGAVEAAQAAALLVADARAKGAQLVSATVSGLVKGDGGVEGVILSTGETLTADHVVLAAGVRSTQVCGSIGITLPVNGRSGMLVHSKPVSRRLLSGIVLAPGLHMRQTAEGRLLAGAGFAGTDPGVNPQARAEELFTRVKGLFDAKDVSKDVLELDFFTIGERPTPQDGFPILGGTGVEGLTLAVMHSGVTLAAIVGEVLADEIVLGKKDPALDNFAFSRFGSVTA